MMDFIIGVAFIVWLVLGIYWMAHQGPDDNVPYL